MFDLNRDVVPSYDALLRVACFLLKTKTCAARVWACHRSEMAQTCLHLCMRILVQPSKLPFAFACLFWLNPQVLRREAFMVPLDSAFRFAARHQP